MIKEALQFLSDQAIGAQRVRTLDLPDGRMLVTHPDGNSTIETKDRNVHEDLIADSVSLSEWCAKIGASQEELVFKVTGGRICVHSVRDWSHRSDSADMVLDATAAFNTLDAWRGCGMKPKAIVRALRTSLSGTFDSTYQAIFKQVVFEMTKASTHKASHASDSLGRSVDAEAKTSGGDLPETLTFDVRLFQNVEVGSYELTYAVDVDHADEKIQIEPIGDCIEEAIRQTRKEIAASLRSEFPNAMVLEV